MGAGLSLHGVEQKGHERTQLHRSIGVTYKTAWFMWHRIREAMREDVLPPMGGEGEVVEADETFIGPNRMVFVNNKGWQKAARSRLASALS